MYQRGTERNDALVYEIKNLFGSVASLMSSKREKIIVLDVEGYSTTRPYNVGYIVCDLYGNIYRKRSFALLPCIWENIRAMVNCRQAETMTKKNVEEILQDIEKPKHKRKYKPISPEKFTEIFTADIQNFKVKRLFAYNVNFDKGSIKRLIGDKTFIDLNLTYCDIISGITTTKLMSKSYIEFCKSHGFMTEKGNVQTKAEVVYKYLTNNLDFEEEHTGLADVLIEYRILLTALKAHKKIDWKPCPAWKLLKTYADEKGISLVT